MEMRGVISDKQLLLSLLDNTYLLAQSKQDFYHRLRKLQMTLYSRQGKVAGIRMRRKFRFKTLGYTKETLQKLDKGLIKEKRVEELERIRERRKDRLPNKDKER